MYLYIERTMERCCQVCFDTNFVKDSKGKQRCFTCYENSLREAAQIQNRSIKVELENLTKKKCRCVNFHGLEIKCIQCEPVEKNNNDKHNWF